MAPTWAGPGLFVILLACLLKPKARSCIIMHILGALLKKCAEILPTSELKLVLKPYRNTRNFL